MDKLWTRSFLNICASNFLMFYAFYLVFPVLPLYIIEQFKVSSTITGLVLSTYMVGSLLCRPFAGYLVDTFSRKPLYLVTFALFTCVFAGYLVAITLSLLALTRLVHGLSFGLVTTASNTIAVDVLPSSRRGEGIGYFGVATNIAFALGPMTGVLVFENYGFNAVFMVSLVISLVGLLLALPLKIQVKRPKEGARPISLDRFFLTNAIPQFLCLVVIGFSYGPVINYITLYGKEIGISGSVGYFYAFLALGLIISRLFSGKLIDKGYLTRLILAGTVILTFTFAILGLFPNPVVFFAAAFFIGLGNGMVCPSYQNLFVNMARHNQRGTASSTYLSAWDVGIGLGILSGGYIAEKFSYGVVFVMSSLGIALSLLLFHKVGAPHYEKNRLYP